MKRIAATLAASLFCFALSLPIHSESHAKPLVLGMTPEPYMPFTQINSAGEWEGLEAELTMKICDKLAEGCTTKQMAWEGLIPSLTKNKVDFVVGAFTINEERKKVIDFSLPYFKELSVLVGMKNDKTQIRNKAASDGNGEIVDTASLSGKIIGVQNASIDSAYAKAHLKGVEVKSYTTADNIIADLTAGRIDYVMASKAYMMSFLSSEQGSDYAISHEVPDDLIMGEGIAYAVRKGDAETRTEIDTVIAELTASGELKQMVDKWFFSN